VPFFALAALASAAPFQNGGFELPDMLPEGGAVVLNAGDTRIAGWITGGTNQSVSWIKDSPWVLDGRYLIGFEKVNPAGGWIQQTFYTVPDISYHVRFGVSGILFSGNSNSFLKVEVFSEQGNLVASASEPVFSGFPGEPSFRSLTFTATSRTSALRFTEISQRWATLWLDAVSVEGENPELELALYPGIKITGLVGYTYAIQFQNTLNTDEWFPLTTITLQQPSQLIFDTNGLTPSQRIYRAVKVP
jgi:hypothetical protein